MNKTLTSLGLIALLGTGCTTMKTQSVKKAPVQSCHDMSVDLDGLDLLLRAEFGCFGRGGGKTEQEALQCAHRNYKKCRNDDNSQYSVVCTEYDGGSLCVVGEKAATVINHYPLIIKKRLEAERMSPKTENQKPNHTL